MTWTYAESGPLVQSVVPTLGNWLSSSWMDCELESTRHAGAAAVVGAAACSCACVATGCSTTAVGLAGVAAAGGVRLPQADSANANNKIKEGIVFRIGLHISTTE